MTHKNAWKRILIFSKNEFPFFLHFIDEGKCTHKPHHISSTTQDGVKRSVSLDSTCSEAPEPPIWQISTVCAYLVGRHDRNAPLLHRQSLQSLSTPAAPLHYSLANWYGLHSIVRSQWRPAALYSLIRRRLASTRPMRLMERLSLSPTGSLRLSSQTIMTLSSQRGSYRESKCSDLP